MNTPTFVRNLNLGRRWLLVVAVIFAAGVSVYALSGSDEPNTTSLDRTLQDLEDQVRAQPQDLEARLAVAAAYTQRGRLSDAVAQYEQALVLEEENQTALIGLGRVYLDQGKLDEAFVALEKVADLNADNPMRYTIEELEAVYYDLAQIHLDRGEFEEARSRLEEALQINATDADALRMLGNVEAELGNVKAAEQAFLSAVRLVPDFAEAYHDLQDLYASQADLGGEMFAQGMLQLTQNRLTESVESLEQSVQSKPRFADAHQGLGMAYETKGDLPAALAAYQRAAELNPNLFLSTSAVERLKVNVGSTPASSGN